MNAAIPRVTVIVPAFEAATTIDRTIDCLRAQSFEEWEAVVVDDGSTDASVSVVERATQGDPRVRIVSQPNRGLAAARNRGIGEARGALLLFLDADDWIRPDMLARMVARFEEDPSLAAVHCGWARVLDDGTELEREPAVGEGDLFDEFAQRCAFPVHACLVRRRIVDAAGGFDESLVVLEDWDLWQRIARTGAGFGLVDSVLAFYRWRPDSMSSGAGRMLAASLSRITRGHAPDERVPAGTVHSAGRSPARVAEALYGMLCWWAGTRLGKEADAVELVAHVGEPCPTLDAAAVAVQVLRSAAIARGCSRDEWWRVWASCREAGVRLLEAIEERSRAPLLAARALGRMDVLALESAPPGATARIGATERIEVEAGGPLPHHDFGPSIRRALFSVTWRGEPLGDVTLPVCDGRVRSDVLGDAIAARHGWSIVDRWLAGRAEGSSPAADPWTEFLRALYDAPDRPAEWFYDPEAAPVGGSDLTTPAAEGLELGEPLREVERNGARAIEVRIAGATIGVVPLPPGEGRIPASAVRAAITRACGLELVRVVAREALLGAGENGGRPLRDRLALRAARAERDPALRARRCGGFAIALPRHRPGPVETTASRRAALPEEVVRACARSFPAFGGSLVEGDGAGALYLPDLIGREDDRIPLVDEALPEAADRLPILMYHRVTGAPPRNRWALDPDVFEAQLRWLAENGFRTVGLEDLRRARLARRLPRRCVVLTFDDGTLDFETEAWPRLRAYGFAATLFVVTGFAGGTSLWDEGRVPALGLLDWRAIERMRSDGLEIGSHSERHRPLSALDPDDIAQECLRSRCAIAERLGAPPTAIAYPYGDADPVVEHLAGACGYLFGLTCESRMMTVDDRLLAMPRIEVAGDEPLAAFMQRLEPAA